MSSASQSKKRMRIGVLRGGPSHSYEASLQSGAEVLKTLRGSYPVLDILISRDGVWHVDGKEKRPEKILPLLDLAYVALHGSYGEDGRVQTLLEQFGVPYTGSRPLPSALAMNKIHVQKHVGTHIRMPTATRISHKEHTKKDVALLFRMFPQPSIVKPATGSTSVGVSIVRNFHEFEKAIENALRFSPFAIVEEYVPGLEVTCSVLESVDGTQVYALPCIEIRKQDHVHSYEMRCNVNNLDCLRLLDIDKETIQEIQRLAIQSHTMLGLRHYSSSDFIVSPHRGVYLLETDSLPELASHTAFHHALRNTGLSFEDFLSHTIDSAYMRT